MFAGHIWLDSLSNLKAVQDFVSRAQEVEKSPFCPVRKRLLPRGRIHPIFSFPLSPLPNLDLAPGCDSFAVSSGAASSA
ncbi:hypothetical protein VTN49DRAFT_1433 [Thermomyces lanuginosus]|uniref:uncharacterized protein n=1 Tax=Thermomyces lanuginosus TaxID=5541 RepID=UPI0037437403